MTPSKSQVSGQGPLNPSRIKRKRTGLDHKLPVIFVILWFVCEFLPALIPSETGIDLYWDLYFYSEDLSTIFLALSFYTALSYTSVILKGLSLSAVVISIGLIATNILVDVVGFPQKHSTALVIGCCLYALQLYMTRFIFSVNEEYQNPEPDTIYLVVTKPHDLWGMAGLFWSGIGGGFSAYVNGYCYWFSREKGVMIREYTPDYYKGRKLIYCGPATLEKTEDLDSLVGRKWSIWNNCFVVFGRWRRTWHV